MSENKKSERNLKKMRYISQGNKEKAAIKEREREQRKLEDREKRRKVRETRKNDEIINHSKDKNLPKKTFKWHSSGANKAVKDTTEKKNQFEIITNNKSNAFLKLLCVALAIVMFVFGMNILMPMGISETFKNFVVGVGGGDGFPVSISAATTETIVPVSGDTALLTDSTLMLYKQNGKVIFNRQHGYSNPVVCSGGSRALLFDRDGNRYRIENRAETLYELNVEDSILTADVADRGSYALVTSSKEYLCTVTVYNKNAESVFVWNSAERRVSSISLSSTGKYLALGTIKAENGVFCSELLIFNIKKSVQPIVTQKFDGSAMLSVDYKSSGVLCVLDNMASFVTKKGVRQDYSYDSAEPVSFCNSSAKGATIVLRRYNDAENNLVVTFNNRFKILYENEVLKECLDVSMCGNKVAVLHKGGVTAFGGRGKITFEGETRVDSDKILSYKHHAMVLTTTSVEYIKY